MWIVSFPIFPVIGPFFLILPTFTAKVLLTVNARHTNDEPGIPQLRFYSVCIVKEVTNYNLSAPAFHVQYGDDND